MSHAYNKIWIHAVWATKYRRPLIEPKIERFVYEFVANQFRDMGCPVRIVNGMPDHIHCLFLLSSQYSIAEVIKQVKGSSSFTFNQMNLISEKFSWQTGYGSFSVSESVVDRVYRYIRNQKQHHREKDVEQEFDDFLELHSMEKRNEKAQEN